MRCCGWPRNGATARGTPGCLPSRSASVPTSEDAGLRPSPSGQRPDRRGSDCCLWTKGKRASGHGLGRGPGTQPGLWARDPLFCPRRTCARAIAIINEMSRLSPRPGRLSGRPTRDAASHGPRKPPARRASVDHRLSEATIPVGVRLTTTSYLKMYDRRLWRPPLRNGEALEGRCWRTRGRSGAALSVTR